MNTAQEAVRALCANYPAFERYLREHSEPGYHVFIGKRNIGEADLSEPAGRDVIKIVPAVAGAKKGGILQIVIGAVLAIVGVVTGQTWLVQIGAVLALGGVAQMLTPTPKIDSGQQSENKPSYVFSGATNTTAQGNPVPVLYGEMVIGSAVISAGMSASEF